MFASMLKSNIGQRLLGWQPLGYLCTSKSNPQLYLLGEYPVHQGEINRPHPISASSVSSASVCTMAGVTTEGTVEVDSLSTLTSFV